MKKRLTAVVALAALLMCALAGAALAQTLDTEVAVTFVESIYFDEPETGGMDVAFGMRKLPPLNDDTLISAEDGSHTLRVRDRRMTAGSWTVDAVMTSMANGPDSFTCALRLYNPVLTEGLTANLTAANQTEEDEEEPDEYVFITQTSQPIMAAEAGLTQDDYELTVTAPNTRLLITADQSKQLRIFNYKATITWTLTLTP